MVWRRSTPRPSTRRSGSTRAVNSGALIGSWSGVGAPADPADGRRPSSTRSRAEASAPGSGPHAPNSRTRVSKRSVGGSTRPEKYSPTMPWASRFARARDRSTERPPSCGHACGASDGARRPGRSGRSPRPPRRRVNPASHFRVTPPVVDQVTRPIQSVQRCPTSPTRARSGGDHRCGWIPATTGRRVSPHAAAGRTPCGIHRRSARSCGCGDDAASPLSRVATGRTGDRTTRGPLTAAPESFVPTALPRRTAPMTAAFLPPSCALSRDRRISVQLPPYQPEIIYR